MLILLVSWIDTQGVVLFDIQISNDCGVLALVTLYKLSFGSNITISVEMTLAMVKFDIRLSSRIAAQALVLSES